MAFAGISLKTQELYALVFVCRYLDLFFSYVSLYNSVMKIIYLVTAFWIVYLMRADIAVRQTYDVERDTFRYIFLIVPCMILALLIHYSSSLTEILWTFSIYLEAVAITKDGETPFQLETDHFIPLFGWNLIPKWNRFSYLFILRILCRFKLLDL